MKRKFFSSMVLLFFILVTVFANDASAIPVTFDKLTGLTGGSPTLTGVYRADLSSIDFDILSISITDSSFGLGGATGQFSGFDLDAIMLSTTSVNSASAAAALPGLPVFDFSTSGTFFTPGTQRVSIDPKLFGTDIHGAAVNNSVATLDSFDGNATTAIPGADGFVSLGDGGILAFSLTSAVSTSGGLYLYIGEVGDNGEVAAGTIDVSDRPIAPVPEPSTILLMGIGLLGLVGYSRKRSKKS